MSVVIGVFGGGSGVQGMYRKRGASRASSLRVSHVSSSSHVEEEKCFRASSLPSPPSSFLSILMLQSATEKRKCGGATTRPSPVLHPHWSRAGREGREGREGRIIHTRRGLLAVGFPSTPSRKERQLGPEITVASKVRDVSGRGGALESQRGQCGLNHRCVLLSV